MAQGRQRCLPTCKEGRPLSLNEEFESIPSVSDETNHDPVRSFIVRLRRVLSGKKMGQNNLFVSLEHITGWPIVLRARYATAKVVRNVIYAEVIHPFRIFVSHNAQCFTALLMR